MEKVTITKLEKQIMNLKSISGPRFDYTILLTPQSCPVKMDTWFFLILS